MECMNTALLLNEIIISRFILKFLLKTILAENHTFHFNRTSNSSFCPWTILSATLGPSDGLGLFARAPLDDVTVSIGSVGPLFFPCWQFRQRYACTEPVSSKPPPRISLSLSLRRCVFSPFFVSLSGCQAPPVAASGEQRDDQYVAPERRRNGAG